MRVRSAIAFILLVGCARAQDSTFCTSTVVGQARPKGIELTYERVVDYAVDTRRAANEALRFDSEVRRNRRIELKARVPVLNRPDWKLSLGLAYRTENYSFEESSGPGTILLDQLEERPLKSIATTLYMGRFFRRTYLLARARASLDRDGVESPDNENNPIKYTVAVLFGWKRSANTTYGFGAAFSYLLGQGQLLPVLSLAHTFTPRFGIEALLPQSIKGRFNLSEKDLLYLNAEVDGANYNLVFDAPQLSGTYFLERSSLRTYARYEHELHDWLWCGADLGWSRPINLSLTTDHDADRGEEVIHARATDALFFNVGVFIVPPRKMMK